MKTKISCVVGLAAGLAIFFLANALGAQNQLHDTPKIVRPTTSQTISGRTTKGRFRVWENRQAQSGRKIHLNFVVLHARAETPKPDPLFFIVGGPGQPATSITSQFENHWARENRDIVLLDQRGTGGDNRLAFDYADTGGSLQQYFDPIMDESVVRRNFDRLNKMADLRMYSTPIAADDLDDFREAMGYEKINVMGGSYGTRACLVYIRRHGQTVRTATLAGCARIEFRNPLYHSESAQRALEMMFREAASTEVYRNSFGDVRKKFGEILRRLDTQPARVEIQNQSTGKTETVSMNRSDFLSSVRFQLYYTNASRELPRLLCEAHAGDFRPFAVNSLRLNRALRQSLALGMLLSVTAAEDVARIKESEIAKLTKETVFGDARVRSQIAAAKIWPHSDLPPDFSQPVRSDVPALILSGSIDPVTPPKWGEMVHKSFPNSVHLVFPTAHDVNGPCVDRIRRQFLESGSVEGLDTDCIEQMKLPPLRLTTQ